MRQCAALFAVLLAACSPSPDDKAARYDLYLERVIAAYDLRPLPTKPFEETAKFRLGQALFFDPLLSGSRDVSCATCHVLGRGLSDALPASIGTGGTGLAEARMLPPGRPAQPRNALDLWNRDNNAVQTMFWDGRAEVFATEPRTFRSPLGDRLPAGFENLMAVQAIFPLTQEDEMLGLPGDTSSASLPAPHGGLANDLAFGTDSLAESVRIETVLRRIIDRLFGAPDALPTPWQAEYRRLFQEAYPDLTGDRVSIVALANALAHFEEIAFATRDTPWDKYLSGDRMAIRADAKRGAFLFFGKGACAVCHSGPLFSDFAFHSIGVRAFGPGYDGAGDDQGRFRVTGRKEDRYKFRTPPLRNVTLSAPYFHNGSAATLEDALGRHLDPLFWADKYDATGAPVMRPDEIEAVSPIVLIRAGLSNGDVADLIAFLKTLEDPAAKTAARIVPSAVPSGLPIASVPP